MATSRILVFLAALSPLLCAAAEPCLHYEPEIVHLTGHVSVHVFPRLNPDDDHLDTETLLKLDTPLCVAADPASEHNRAPLSAQTEITLLQSKTLNPRRFRARRVNVEGTLFHAYLPEHRTPLMMNIINATVIPPAKTPPHMHPDRKWHPPKANAWRQPAKKPGTPKTGKSKPGSGTPAEKINPFAPPLPPPPKVPRIPGPDTNPNPNEI